MPRPPVKNGSSFILLALVLMMSGGAAISARAPAAASRDRPTSAAAAAIAKGTGATPASTGAARSEPQAVSLLERFAAAALTPSSRTQAAATPEPGARDRAALATARIRTLGYDGVHVLVATVPDPRDSRLVKLFDDHVAAIRVALERSGFVDDRFYDPWGGPDDPDPDGAAAVYRDQPGLLLFRRMARHDGVAKRDLMVLLLVGESSTWGVHRVALQTAFDIAAGILANACVDPDAPASGGGGTFDVPRPVGPRLPLVAPTMSGTAESLRLGIEQWFGRQRALPAVPGGCVPRDRAPFNLEFISGSATGADNPAVLGSELTAQVGHQFPDFRSSFRATVHPDDDLRPFIVRYLAEALHLKRFGFLSESGTTYGARFGTSYASSMGKPTIEVPGAPRVINLPFPLHVSKLRSEYDRHHPAEHDPSRETATHRLLGLERDDDVGMDDSFPARSHVTQSASEISMQQVLHAIATEDVDAVVVVATDAADQRFLVEKVRASFPNVTVVVSGADLLDLHDDVPFMDGVLVATSYPLSPWSQRITFPFEGDRDRLLFPTSGAQGVYNATLLLIDDLNDDDAYADILDYGAPFDLGPEPQRPPLWMMVVSGGAFWPLSVEDGRPGGGYLQDAEKIPGNNDLEADYTTAWTPPRSFCFFLAIVLLALLDGLLIAGYLLARGTSAARDPEAAHPLDPFALFLPPAIFPYKRMQQLEVATVLLVFMLVNAAFAVIGLAEALPAPRQARVLSWALTLLPGVPAAVLLVLFFDAIARCVGLLDAQAKRWSGFCALMVAVVVTWFATSRLLALMDVQRAGHHVALLMFVVERARNLDSGVSPVWMAVLLGVAHICWSVGHLRQVRIVEDAAVLRRYGVLPTAPAGAPPVGSVPQLLDKLGLTAPMRAAVKQAEGVLPSRFTKALMAIVALDCIWISRHLVSFEGRAVGAVFTLAYAILLALVVFACARLVLTWRALELVLARVAPLPVTEALRRIPGKLLTSFKRPWDNYVFEVWQRRCPIVFANFRDQPPPKQAWPSSVGIDPDDRRWLMAESVAVQLERSGQAEAGPAGAAPKDLGGGDAAGAGEGGEHRSIVDAVIGGADAAHGRSAPVVTDDERTRAWEEFLAMRLVAFVQYIRTHISNFVAVITATLLPAMWASSVYPLRGNRFLLMLVLAVAGAAITVTTVVFVQMSRNYVLSRLARNNPGSVTWDRGFVTSLLVHVALPLIALIAVKFPELGRAWTLLTGALSALGGGSGGGG
jgi:hypothetical protein